MKFGVHMYYVFDHFGDFLVRLTAESADEAVEKAKQYGYFTAVTAIE